MARASRPSLVQRDPNAHGGGGGDRSDSTRNARGLANFRHPLTLAKEIVTLDDISSGRLTLGIGQGSTGWDATMLDATPSSPRDRSERFREFVELTDLLLREPETTYLGSFYSVPGRSYLPGLRPAPPGPDGDRCQRTQGNATRCPVRRDLGH